MFLCAFPGAAELEDPDSPPGAPGGENPTDSNLSRRATALVDIRERRALEARPNGRMPRRERSRNSPWRHRASAVGEVEHVLCGDGPVSAAVAELATGEIVV